MNREQKRAAQFKRGQRYTPHGTCVTENDLAHNRIAHALVRARIMDEVLQLRTRAGIHAYTGEDAAQVADAMGRLLFKDGKQAAHPLQVPRIPLSATAQVRMCGNSVSPPQAEALVRANFGHEAEIYGKASG